MTQEITDIIERNLVNLFDELDDLTWDGTEYNEYIQEDVLTVLGDYGVWDEYNNHIAYKEPVTYVLHHFDAMKLDDETWEKLFGAFMPTENKYWVQECGLSL